MNFKCGYIALIGKPNAGKSTLLNAILEEQLSIVTAKAQTTRHRIVGILNRKDAQVIFLDTPGYHVSPKLLNTVMCKVVDNVISDADAVCLLIDVSNPDLDFNKQLFEKIGEQRCIVLLNKADKVSKEKYEQIAHKLHQDWGAKEIIVMSALRSLGTAEFLRSIIERLPAGVALYPTDIYTEHPVRFLVAELIREQVFLQMHEEIPYSSAVEIEKYSEASGNKKLPEISAAIVVERESQKGMIIGNKGVRIKEIGKLARKKIEEMLGNKIVLKLFVRVDPNWTKNHHKLKEFGYSA